MPVFPQLSMNPEVREHLRNVYTNNEVCTFNQIPVHLPRSLYVLFIFVNWTALFHRPLNIIYKEMLQNEQNSTILSKSS